MPRAVQRTGAGGTTAKASAIPSLSCSQHIDTRAGVPRVTCHVAGWSECSGELLEVGGRTLEVASEALAMARALAHQSCIGRALARHSAFDVGMALYSYGTVPSMRNFGTSGPAPTESRAPFSRPYKVMALYSTGPIQLWALFRGARKETRTKSRHKAREGTERKCSRYAGQNHGLPMPIAASNEATAHGGCSCGLDWPQQPTCHHPTPDPTNP